VLLGSLQAGHRHCSVSSSEGVVVCAVFDARRVVRLVASVAHWHVGVSSVVCCWQRASRSHVHSHQEWRSIRQHGFRPFDKMARLLVRPRAQASMVLGSHRTRYWDCLMRVVPC
jgi:hypothetical protein